jgi:hypothetical protein
MACGFDPNTSILAGVTTPVLQGWLADAQAAMARFSTGAQEVTVVVTGGGQHREVTFARTDMATLTQWIRLLQAQLGTITRPRRAIGVTF